MRPNLLLAGAVLVLAVPAAAQSNMQMSMPTGMSMPEMPTHKPKTKKGVASHPAKRHAKRVAKKHQWTSRTGAPAADQRPHATPMADGSTKSTSGQAVMPAMDASAMRAMESPTTAPLDHSSMTGMDPAAMPGMDHSAMPPAEQQTTPTIGQPAPSDHSGMAGMTGMHNSATPMMDPNMSGMDHSAMSHALGEGSGTSRLPRAEGPMPGIHFDIGSGWMGMAHGYAWGVYTDQTGPRGDHGVFVQSMAMLMAEKPFNWGKLQLRTMMSAEPLMTARGYPNLFATGETANGVPLVDRQHPHDLFMELAARVDVNLAPGTTAYLYGGPVAEPALGPSAFMHRASARLNPEAPISHHWFDSTHITYGVITAGVGGKYWQIEGSAFRGREPDEKRWNIETPKLDSWSVRATLTPSPNWALQVSHGFLKEPEANHPGEDEFRTTASVHYANAAGLSAMAAFSAKDARPGKTRTAWLLEANWDITKHHTLFGRFENVANSELFPRPSDLLHDQTFRVTKLQAGYAYTLPVGPFGLSVGGTAATFLKPAALDAFYGYHPMGYTVFAKLTLGR